MMLSYIGNRVETQTCFCDMIIIYKFRVSRIKRLLLTITN